MKYKITLLIGVLIISSSVYGQIRSTTWGDSAEEVKATITEEIANEQKDGRKYVFVVATTVGSKDAVIGYVFADNQLVRINYAFTETHSNDNNYITDFIEIAKILTQKYDEPETEKKAPSMVPGRK